MIFAGVCVRIRSGDFSDGLSSGSGLETAESLRGLQALWRKKTANNNDNNILIAIRITIVIMIMIFPPVVHMVLHTVVFFGILAAAVQRWLLLVMVNLASASQCSSISYIYIYSLYYRTLWYILVTSIL